MRALLFTLALTLPFTGSSQNAIEEVVSILNAVRTDPQNFIIEYLNPYIEKNNLLENKYATSLITELKSVKKMEALQLAPKISKISKAHAIDMGSKGKVGHNSSDGTTFDKRLRLKAKAGGAIGENCDYGNEKPIDIVMSLLIDNDIESLGHRKNILEPRFRFIGVAIEPHKKYRISCVMDFVEKI
ncbi:MAG: CAP domain-containing protein [Cyclobacteriaceae bacterium]